MRKARSVRKHAAPARKTVAAGLLFEIDSRQLRSMLGRRVVRRRSLADGQRRMLERLIKASGTPDELLVKGEISPETYEEWNRETGGKKLPERVKREATKKRGSRKR